jgi:hypothetical protein
MERFNEWQYLSNCLFGKRPRIVSLLLRVAERQQLTLSQGYILGDIMRRSVGHSQTPDTLSVEGESIASRRLAEDCRTRT